MDDARSMHEMEQRLRPPSTAASPSRLVEAEALALRLALSSSSRLGGSGMQLLTLSCPPNHY